MDFSYDRNSLTGKLISWFSSLFSSETAPTRAHLVLLCLSIVSFNICPSVRMLYRFFIAQFSKFKLKSFYYTLKNSKVYLNSWTKLFLVNCLKLLSKNQYPVILAVDDTLVEKKEKL